MKEFNNFKQAQRYAIKEVLTNYDFQNKDNVEKIGLSFKLIDPSKNKNSYSNYKYAEEFFKWIMTGEKLLSEELMELNPYAKKFVDSTNLPTNFSTSYGWKILEQIEVAKTQLVEGGRRAFISILTPQDSEVLKVQTTHEYPCTTGIHLMVREGRLFANVQMRSNNVYSVMPYDVYNFTNFQMDLAKKLGLELGTYSHQISSAHIYDRDLAKTLKYML